MIVGRRGPAQAAFTNPELRELGELTDADVIVDPAEVELDDHSARSIEGDGEITHRRNVEILADYAGRTPEGKPKRVVLRFLRSPVAIHGDGRVESIELVRNELEHGGDGRLRAQSTGEHETLEAGLVFRSIGYRGAPVEGVPFDDWHGTIPNEEGRIIDPETEGSIPGEYVAGWVKRGPSGVIGTNKRDAQETVEHLLEDLGEGRLPEPADPDPDGARGAGARAPARPGGLLRLGGHRRRRAGGRRAAGPPAREVHLGQRDAGCGTLRPSSASSARSGEAEMQVKMGVSDSV